MRAGATGASSAQVPRVLLHGLAKFARKPRLTNPRPDAPYCFVKLNPLTVTSVLCAIRIPYNPSVLFNFPAPTTADLS